MYIIQKRISVLDLRENSMKILLLGGSGWLGHNIALLLASKSIDFTIAFLKMCVRMEEQINYGGAIQWHMLLVKLV